MKFLLFSIFIFSCSGGNNAKKFSGVELSENETMAKSLIQSEMNSLSQPQYGITDSELALLTKEGLVTGDEKKSLKIIK